jgi:hypothetical protein
MAAAAAAKEEEEEEEEERGRLCGFHKSTPPHALTPWMKM